MSDLRPDRKRALGIGAVGISALAKPSLHGLWPTYSFVVLEVLIVASALVGVGALLTGHRRSTSSGRWLIVSALLWVLMGSGIGQSGAGPLISWFASSVIWIALALAVSTFPRGQAWTREHRMFFAILVPHLVLFSTLLAVISRPEWSGYDGAAWWPTAVEARGTYVACSVLVSVLDLLMALWFVRIMVLRLRSMTGMDRSALVPALWGASTAVLVGSLAALVQNIVLSQDSWAFGLFTQGLGLLALAGAVAFAAHRVRTMRTRIADLVQVLAAAPDPDSIRQVLREGLRDPGLEIFSWSGPEVGHVDRSGAPAPLTTGEDRLVVPVVGADGRPLAVVSADPRLRPHAEFVITAVAAAGFVLENARLQAELRGRIAEVEISRSQIVEAQRAERERVADDLHDGLQQALLGLAARARAVERSAERPDVREASGRLVESALTAVELVRQVSRGLSSPLLRSHGLQAAVEDVTDHLDLEVEVDVMSAPESDVVADVAFLWISEALANVAKHASARRAWVSVRRERQELVIDVRDDGIGGVAAGGTALRALHRRAQAVDGRVSVVSPPGGGTTVSVALPDSLDVLP